ncbi:MAG: tRNA uridine-5-carboxymethylaminomethyl(34) synthesis GTPase MnmE [Prevotellaceae bacterium]|jgi:tRNA modification GTPase|nr:tRNA uridine-5-carboxymethylaminomethyl(34) synthesis GTPase MnmE [Prevotellaceae bacterium]
MIDLSSTIAAISTPAGVGGIAVVRISGAQAFDVCDKIFASPTGKKLSEQKTATAHFGKIIFENTTIDEVLATVFRAPHSFTGEDTVEISCHGSTYIQQQILQALMGSGASMAQPGEFTMRAFLNGKMDLAQAEAVADLIASSTRAMHRVAMQQMRGGYSNDIRALRDKLLHFASMLELELDFTDEDVEFANRDELKNLLREILRVIEKLTASFSVGNAIKKGVPVAIVGAPNVGKSTLLNALLNDEKAIVSDIEGTTRDAIEDTITLGGVLFRFIDTAGIRHSTDVVENLGIERTFEKMSKAAIVILLLDATRPETFGSLEKIQAQLSAEQQLVVVVNKSDALNNSCHCGLDPQSPDFEIAGQARNDSGIKLSAKNKTGLQELEQKLLECASIPNSLGSDSIVSNARHYEAFSHAQQSIERALEGLNTGLSEELVAFEIREATRLLGSIVGDISDNDILGNIFEKFCVGK